MFSTSNEIHLFVFYENPNSTTQPLASLDSDSNALILIRVEQTILMKAAQGPHVKTGLAWATFCYSLPVLSYCLSQALASIKTSIQEVCLCIVV